MALTNSTLLKDAFVQAIIDRVPIGSQIQVYSSNRTLLVTVSITNSTFTRTAPGVATLVKRPSAVVTTSGIASSVEFIDPQGQTIFTVTCGMANEGQPIVLSNTNLTAGANFTLEKIDYNV